MQIDGQMGEGRASLAAAGRGVAVWLTLTLEGRPGKAMYWTTADLFPLSTSRPWEFGPVAWRAMGARVDGEALCVTGRSARLDVEARFSFREGLLHVAVRWTAREAIDAAAVALVLDVGRGAGAKVTLPQVLYNGNPSADPGRLVPRFGKGPGECLVCEETRFPIPGVNVEWAEEAGPAALSVFTVPRGDADWSMGVQRADDESLRVLVASGVLALNSRKDLTYGGQCKAEPLAAGYRTLRAGDVLEKEFFVELFEPGHAGHGFRSLASTGYRIYRPAARPCLTLERMIELKANALVDRWREEGEVAGYLCMTPVNLYNRRPYFLYGWTGQGLRLAWCDAKLGFDGGRGEGVERCRKAVDFYVRGSRAPADGLRYSHYQLEPGRWNGFEPGYETRPHDPARDFVAARAFGEAMWNLGKVVELFKAHGAAVPRAWGEALGESADYLMRPESRNEAGVFPRSWSPVSGRPLPGTVYAAGIPCVLALLAAHRASAPGKGYVEECVRLVDAYWRMCGDRFDRPFAGSTLDADCEDKEAGIYFFLAAVELWELTGEARFRDYAEVAADWVLTFLYYWHTPFRPGTPCEANGFVATGWSCVSVQNQHLDVFFPAAELCAFGRRIGNRRLEELGRLALLAWSHGIVQRPGHWGGGVPGEQYEQYYQTNYGPRELGANIWRGGFIAANPSWIIGMVLEGALRVRDMDRAAGA